MAFEIAFGLVLANYMIKFIDWLFENHGKTIRRWLAILFTYAVAAGAAAFAFDLAGGDLSSNKSIVPVYGIPLLITILGWNKNFLKSS